ncbi:hypothetical protein LSPH24S_05710 [Lysinibacillus sphaericus]
MYVQLDSESIDARGRKKKWLRFEIVQSVMSFLIIQGSEKYSHKWMHNLKSPELYQIVYRYFLRKRENRAATVERIVEATGAEEDLLYHRWVRKVSFISLQCSQT